MGQVVHPDVDRLKDLESQNEELKALQEEHELVIELLKEEIMERQQNTAFNLTELTEALAVLKNQEETENVTKRTTTTTYTEENVAVTARKRPPRGFTSPRG